MKELLMRSRKERHFSRDAFLWEKWKNRILLASGVFLFFFILLKGAFVTSWGPATNYINYSVKTTVNVTNAYPEVLNASCNSGQPITLAAGTTMTVNCTIQLRDYNGWDDINKVNGTFYYYANLSDDPDDNNVHYSNTSCNYTSNDGEYLVNFTCSFDVWYYANNGTWRINVTANDTYSKTDNDYGNATISALLALNVTSVIDFEDLAVTETSTEAISANVTNFGNRPINVSVYGFGGESEATGAGYAMICAIRNITLPNERYDLDSATIYDDMTPITSAPVTIPDLTIQKQTDPATQMTNATYWRIHINLTSNPFGVCNGTVVFSALAP
ncbi:hypothetical protein JW756_05850 [Candidatus Woesearchaeota archaeon]|nr:hypothetical protein [Candidatus Woesearchaeota archaeon]